MSGGQCLVVRLSDGSRMRVPRHWTDADGGGQGAAHAVQEDRVFTAESLRELTALIDALLQRD